MREHLVQRLRPLLDRPLSASQRLAPRLLGAVMPELVALGADRVLVLQVSKHRDEALNPSQKGVKIGDNDVDNAMLHDRKAQKKS